MPFTDSKVDGDDDVSFVFERSVVIKLFLGTVDGCASLRASQFLVLPRSVSSVIHVHQALLLHIRVRRHEIFLIVQGVAIKSQCQHQTEESTKCCCCVSNNAAYMKGFSLL